MIGPRLQLDRTQLVPLPLEEAFAFYADVSNLEVITPPLAPLPDPHSTPDGGRRGHAEIALVVRMGPA